eukprot:gene475-255_t
MASVKRYEWTKNFPNGDTYRGEATGDNIKDGQGEFFWAETGATYVGEWRNDSMHGTGKLTMPGEGLRGFSYTGSFLKGQRSGSGSCTFANGRSYVGEWYQDRMHGVGCLKGAPGVDDFEQYDGQFSNGVRSGKGRCTYVNGDVYEGTFVKDKRHGTGVLTLGTTATTGAGVPKEGSSGGDAPVQYKGEFQSDQATTSKRNEGGEIRYADGSTYTGGVDQLHREGEGTHVMANGDVYTGSFRANYRDGVGTLRCKDGRTYEGSWRRGKMDGRITYHRPVDPAHPPPPRTLVDYVGPCVQGEMTGSGARAVLADGTVYLCEVRNGEPTGEGQLENSPLTLAPAVFGGDGVLLLQRYNGNFFNGVPDGDGTGIVQILSGNGAGPLGSARSGSVVSSAGARRTSSVLRGSSAGRIAGFHIDYPKEGAYQGKWSQGLPNGQGTWSWDSTEERYKGIVFQGAPHGNGRYDGPGRDVYEGEFGSSPTPRGLAGYSGNWKDGYFEGDGELLIGTAPTPGASSGGKGSGAVAYLHYQGQWRRGEPHGKGTEETAEDRYEGAFVQGRREGHGRVVLNAGSGGEGGSARAPAEYEGPFKAGAIGDGKAEGTMTLRDKTVIIQGNAAVTFAQSGLKFIGTFDHNRIIGDGTIHFPNGDTYHGEVESSSSSSGAAAPPLRGGGVDKWDLTPQRHGKGVYKFVEGGELRCTWKHNVLHGEGTHRAATGEVTERCYVDGIVSKKLGGSSSATAKGSIPPDGGAASAEGNKNHTEAAPKSKPTPKPLVSRLGGEANTIFTPENEFPNTLSAEQLKERMAQNNKKPFKFQRKGEAKQAASAPQPTSPKGSSPTPSSGHGGARPTSSAGPSTPRSGAAAPGRRTSQLAQPKGSPRQNPVPSTRQQQQQQQDGERRRRRSAQGLVGPAAGPTGIPEDASPFQSLPAPFTPPLRLSSPKQNDTLDRFQRGVTGLEEGGFGGAKPNRASAGGRPATPTPATGESPTQRPSQQILSTPLKGQLAALMKEACNIRSTREDEIHFLTEELRGLNEKIWQLRFCISADGKSKLSSSQSSRLCQMSAERRNVMSKLQSILQQSEEGIVWAEHTTHTIDIGSAGRRQVQYEGDKKTTTTQGSLGFGQRGSGQYIYLSIRVQYFSYPSYPPPPPPPSSSCSLLYFLSFFFTPTAIIPAIPFPLSAFLTQEGRKKKRKINCGGGGAYGLWKTDMRRAKAVPCPSAKETIYYNPLNKQSMDEDAPCVSPPCAFCLSLPSPLTSPRLYTDEWNNTNTNNTKSSKWTEEKNISIRSQTQTSKQTSKQQQQQQNSSAVCAALCLAPSWCSVSSPPCASTLRCARLGEYTSPCEAKAKGIPHPESLTIGNPANGQMEPIRVRWTDIVGMDSAPPGSRLCGGRVLAMLDMCAARAAQAAADQASAKTNAKYLCCTVGVTNTMFCSPILHGDTLRLDGRVIHCGSSSIGVYITFYRSSYSCRRETLAGESFFSMVTITPDLKAAKIVPSMVLTDPHDIDMHNRYVHIRRVTQEAQANLAKQQTRQLSYLEADFSINRGKPMHMKMQDTKIEAHRIFFSSFLNNNNTVFGGELMAWMERHAVNCGKTFTGNRHVYCIGMHSVAFPEPVFATDWVVLEAMVIYVRNTTMEVDVTLRAERRGEKGVITNRASFVLINSNDIGINTEIPIGIQLDADTSQEDLQRYMEAKERYHRSVRRFSNFKKKHPKNEVHQKKERGEWGYQKKKKNNNDDPPPPLSSSSPIKNSIQQNTAFAIWMKPKIIDEVATETESNKILITLGKATKEKKKNTWLFLTVRESDGREEQQTTYTNDYVVVLVILREFFMMNSSNTTDPDFFFFALPFLNLFPFHVHDTFRRHKTTPKLDTSSTWTPPPTPTPSGLFSFELQKDISFYLNISLSMLLLALDKRFESEPWRRNIVTIFIIPLSSFVALPSSGYMNLLTSVAATRSQADQEDEGLLYCSARLRQLDTSPNSLRSRERELLARRQRELLYRVELRLLLAEVESKDDVWCVAERVSDALEAWINTVNSQHRLERESSSSSSSHPHRRCSASSSDMLDKLDHQRQVMGIAEDDGGENDPPSVWNIIEKELDRVDATLIRYAASQFVRPRQRGVLGFLQHYLLPLFQRKNDDTKGDIEEDRPNTSQGGSVHYRPTPAPTPMPVPTSSDIRRASGSSTSTTTSIARRSFEMKRLPCRTAAAGGAPPETDSPSLSASSSRSALPRSASQSFCAVPEPDTKTAAGLAAARRRVSLLQLFVMAMILRQVAESSNSIPADDDAARAQLEDMQLDVDLYWEWLLSPTSGGLLDKAELQKWTRLHDTEMKGGSAIEPFWN